MNAKPRIRAGKESETHWVKFDFKGRQIYRKTPFTNKEEAMRWGRALKSAMEKTDCAAVKNALDHAAYRKHAAVITIAETFAAYRKHAGPVREITNPNTIELNINALRNILARARNLEPRDLTPSHIQSLESTAVTALDAALIDAYKADVFKRAQAADDYDVAQSYYRTANSLLRQARSLFTPDLLDAYERHEGLKLPILKPFLTRHGFNKVGKKDYNPPSETIIAKTFAALTDLEKTDPNAFIAIWLTIGFGLRKSEIAKLKPSAFSLHAGRPTVRLIEQTKNGDNNIDIPCANPDSWTRLQPHIEQAQKNGREHLLAGSPTDRHETTFRTISAWMRGLGWDTQKTHHEFRAWAGCQVALNDPRGILAARDFLRHESVDTTERFYGRYLKRVKSAYVALQIPKIELPQLVSKAVS